MLVISLITLVAIFVLDVVFGMYYKFGYRHYWFFEMLHFVAGLFMAMFLSNFFRSNATVLIGVGVVVFLWELAEYLIAKTPRTAKYIKKEFKRKNITPEWKDTVLDIVLDFAGALVFIYLFLN